MPPQFLTYYLSLGILLNYDANVFDSEECMNDRKQCCIKGQEFLWHCWVAAVTSCQAHTIGTASKHHPGRNPSKHIQQVRTF